ncbi:unnamed protein product [marine sediment metagenome]|uniref:Uncharacterized protein n=1 Tax=marine sediment metagenome TaxID=412755 RepID=X1SEA7_9ZZZZ
MFAINLLRIISLFAVGVISIRGSGLSETIDRDVKFIVVPIIIIGRIRANE